ncbi:amino acid permease-domain-containing protein [Fusarium flagelliforme]|uniref:amino acid permease-domain-containing protein n=1 Tax=Fusarium flagelliforme TaxID=2675880 RepID=UPI001E8D3535|nr:amino acid permease-domain-containing protein [Fusarium flagelliforme]KAH7173288.1 amino acid permease-domain-containing protein [Fusarium flagelliforme]
MDTTQSTERSDHSPQPLKQVNPNEGKLVGTLINMPMNPNRIVTKAPTDPFRLTYVDVMSLVINRMIAGTGIFDSPKTVMQGVRSPGIAILFWLCGCIYALTGAHVYIEYGLNVPRYVIDGVEQSVPRSGGDLHYLQYVFPWPRYKKGIVMLSGVLYGISFICIGNMAGNCIQCALRLMEAANPEKEARNFSQGSIRGIAIVIAIFPCLIHAFSRRGGILLNNLLAIVKVLMLIFMIIATWAFAGGPSGVRGLPKGDIDSATANPASGGKAHAQAFLSIIFAFSGFDQPNYVLGEIKRPRKTYPRSMWWGVGLVSILYMAVNICYSGSNVAQEFFYIIFDAKDDSKRHQIKRAISAFLAISSFGNIVVMTYTAARMKQEIAKQGFLPFTSFFAMNKDVSLGRFLMWLEGGERKSKNKAIESGHQGVIETRRYNSQKVGGNRKSCVRLFKFFNASNHREKTPVGALVLHFTSCIVLILATWNTSAGNAYSLLAGLIAYLTSAWFGVFLALGILILHFRGPPTTQPALTLRHCKVPNQGPVKSSWAQMTKGSVNPKLSISCGCLYLVGNLYPIITGWIPPSKVFGARSLAWWTVPLISWCVLAFSALWFLGFIGVARYKSQTGRSKFIYLCEPEFSPAEDVEYRQKSGSGSDLPAGEASAGSHHGGLVLCHETIYRGWEGIETEQLFCHRVEMTDDVAPPAQPVAAQVHGNSNGFQGPADPPANLYENTDFPEFSQNGGPVQEHETLSDPLSCPVQNRQNGW